MNQEDEAFLTAFHRSLEQRELSPADSRYVPVTDYDDAFGPDVILELTRTIARSQSGSISYLTGTRGSGKSTQVLRLKHQLEERGFKVAYVNLEDYLNLRRPLEVVEFLYAMVGAITDAVVQERWIPLEDAVPLGWGRLRDWFRNVVARVDITPTAEIGVGVDLPGVLSAKTDLKAELRSDESFVAAMNAYLGGRVSELAKEANAAVSALVDRVRDASTQHSPWLGLVVLFDSLDHVRGTDFAHVRRSLQELFDLHSRTIRLMAAQTVFVVPQWLHVEGGSVRRVVNIKVTTKDGGEHQPGLRAMREVVRRRVPRGDLARLFRSEDQLDQFIRNSGGHIRDLLYLLEQAEVGANSLPFDDQLLTRARQLLVERLTPLADDEKACLRQVRATHDVPLPTQLEWEALAALFDRHLVLGYVNGGIWYDVHPVIRDQIGTDEK